MRINKQEYKEKITEAFLAAGCLVDFTKALSEMLGIHCAVVDEKANDMSMTSPPEEHAYLGGLKPVCRLSIPNRGKNALFLGVPAERELTEELRAYLEFAAAFLPKFPELTQPVAFNSDTYLESLRAFLFSEDFNQMSSLRVRLAISQRRLYQPPPYCVLISIRAAMKGKSILEIRAAMDQSIITVHGSLIEYGDTLILFRLFKTNEPDPEFWKNLDDFLKKHKAIGCASDMFQDPIRDFRIRVYLARNEQVLDYLYKRNRDTGLVQYDAFKIVAMCYSSLEDDKLMGKNQYVCKTALRIHEYDSQHETEYLRTLLIYLNTKFSLTETSRVLHVHRNTVIYRVDRLKNYFGIDFDEPWDCFNLLLSCHILDITKYMT